MTTVLMIITFTAVGTATAAVRFAMSALDDFANDVAEDQAQEGGERVGAFA